MEDSSGNEASLTILGGSKSGQRFVIEDSVDNIVIGSDPSCRFQIDLPGVSPVHARIWIDPQGVTIYETNSPRGLYVNDDRVVAQAPLRNGDILWLGTPGDEDIVMIQCRFPQRGELRRVFVPPPVDEDAIGETVAYGALPASPQEEESEPEAPAAPEVAEPEVTEPRVAAPEVPEPAVTVPEEAEPAEPMAASAGPPAPPTEVFMVEDAPPPSFPSEPSKFDVDFTKPGFSSTFEEEVDRTVADAPAPEPEPPPPPPLVPASPPPAIAAPPPPPPPSRETPPPTRAEAPPKPPRRTVVRAAPVAPAPAEAPSRRIPAAVLWGVLAAGLVVVALGTYVGVRILRGRSTAEPASPPPTSVAAVAPPAVTLPPVELTPEPTAPPSTLPIDEEITIVTPPPPITVAPTPAPSQRPAAPTPAPSQRPTPTPRPAQRAAATPSPGPTPPAVDAPHTQLPAQVASLLGQAETAVHGRNFEAALREYDEVLRLDPQNSRATQGKAEAQAAAASLKRSFAPGRTSMSGKQAKSEDLGGFETDGVKVTKVPDYSGRIEFEVSPAKVLPGDRYTVRIFLVNDGKKPFKIGAVSVNTTTNGSRAGGSVPVRAREVEPRDRVLLDERTTEWPAGANSWTLEAVVQTDRDATFTNRLTWR